MFQNKEILNEPLFYLFIAATILLSLGYTWGKRRIKRIYLSAFNDLIDVIKPKNHQFTNIGGLTGYHATFILKKREIIKKVEATLTLLPRQSWLYYPFSLLLHGFDKLYITITLSKKMESPQFSEGHIIEKKYSGFRAPKIENVKLLNKEEITWGNRVFLFYYENEEVKEKLKALMKSLSEPGYLRHIAIVPSEQRLYIFMIPKYRKVKENLTPVFRWLYTRLIV